MDKYPADDERTQEELIEKYMYIVRSIAHMYASCMPGWSRAEFEDFISVGTIGLIKAAHTFNPEYSTQFVTYASRCVRNEICMYIRSLNRYRCNVSICSGICLSRSGECTAVEDLLFTDPDVVEEQLMLSEALSELRSALYELSDDDRCIIMHNYGIDGHPKLTQHQIAELMGMTQSSVSRRIKRIICQLKEMLNGEQGSNSQGFYH